MKTNQLLVILALVGAVQTVTAGTDVPAPVSGPMTTVTQNDENENLLADSIGRTLYVFDVDLGQAAPVCTADCSEIWPPYIVTDDEASALKAPLGAVARTNKNLQVTYEGRPVYTYAFDRIQGGDKGDGIGNFWHYIELPAAK